MTTESRKQVRRKRRIRRRDKRRTEHADTQRALGELAAWKLIDHLSSHGIIDFHE